MRGNGQCQGGEEGAKGPGVTRSRCNQDQQKTPINRTPMSLRNWPGVSHASTFSQLWRNDREPPDVGLAPKCTLDCGGWPLGLDPHLGIFDMTPPKGSVHS